MIYPLICFIVLLAAELGYFWLARRFQIVDRPNSRSSHNRVVLRGGGVIFYLAVLLYSVTHDMAFLPFLAGLTIVAIVSFIDDIRGLPGWLRMVAQVAALLVAFHSSYSSLQPWQIVVFLIFFAGVLNVYNFMDGVNGMLALYSLVVLGTFEYMNIRMQPFVSHQLMLSLIFAVLIFGFFNVRTRARCFSGDVGSVSMGLIVIFLFMCYDAAVIDDGENLSFLSFTMVFLIDGVLTVAKRFLYGKNIMQPHREHLYETLVNDRHWPHLVVSAFYALLQLVINVGWFFVPDHNLYTVCVALFLTVGYGLFFFFINRKLQTESNPESASVS